MMSHALFAALLQVRPLWAILAVTMGDESQSTPGATIPGGSSILPITNRVTCVGAVHVVFRNR